MYKTFSNLGQFLQTVIYLDLASFEQIEELYMKFYNRKNEFSHY